MKEGVILVSGAKQVDRPYEGLTENFFHGGGGVCARGQ